ncbi:hypothetical protein TIFTF001_006960 [Ficus carica]|uniref:Uncharacterized protein n=1 Tax=Ficus carica TaxID=3494 RepID=A0AA87ZP04_FICCA|nr:hypothetical protein TIFTF001_006960 [Ficus carica]
MYSAEPDSKKYAAGGRPNPPALASGIPSPFVPSVQVPGRPVGNWTTHLSHCIDESSNCKDPFGI